MSQEPTLDTPVKNAASIIARAIEEYTAVKERGVEYLAEIQSLYASYIDKATFHNLEGTIRNIKHSIKRLNKTIKRVSDIYFINYAKMNINESEVTDVLGTYDRWTEQKDQVAILQKILLDTVSYAKEARKVLIKTLEHLEQCKEAEPTEQVKGE